MAYSLPGLVLSRLATCRHLAQPRSEKLPLRNQGGPCAPARGSHGRTQRRRETSLAGDLPELRDLDGQTGARERAGGRRDRLWRP